MSTKDRPAIIECPEDKVTEAGFESFPASDPPAHNMPGKGESANLPATVRCYLERLGADYEVVRHPGTHCSRETAEAAGVDPDHLIKAVLIKDGSRFVVVLLLAAQHLEFGAVREILGRQCGLATKREVGELFPDCDGEMVPVLANAYGLDILVDRQALRGKRLFLESGRSSSLIRISAATFRGIT